MKTAILITMAIVGIFLVPTWAAAAEPAPVSQPGPAGFFIDPAFPHGDALMVVMRRLLPETKYISLTRPALSEDATHEFVVFFVGQGTDHGFESVYYRYFIFVKLKADSWSKARVFDRGSLGYGRFSGPIEWLEFKGWENGRPNSDQMRMLTEPASAAKPSDALDIPLSFKKSGSIPAAITDTALSLQEADRICFGEAVNALREQLTLGITKTLRDADANEREVALLEGMTPRQIILVGLSVYRRQTHDPRAGKGQFQGWAARSRFSDTVIEEELARFRRKN